MFCIILYKTVTLELFVRSLVMGDYKTLILCFTVTLLKQIIGYKLKTHSLQLQYLNTFVVVTAYGSVSIRFLDVFGWG